MGDGGAGGKARAGEGGAGGDARGGDGGEKILLLPRPDNEKVKVKASFT